MRHVRNFWIKARAEGATNSVETGPRAADGGMDITLYQRTTGEAQEAADILCRWLDGRLTAKVRPNRRWFQVDLHHPDGSVTGLPEGTEIVITSYR